MRKEMPNINHSDTQGRSESSASAVVFHSLWSNWITIGGLLTLALSLILLATFFIFAAISAHTNPYVDIIGYLILPAFFMAGLAIVPLGILLKRRSLRRRFPEAQTTLRLPALDLNDARQRKFILGFVAVTVLIVLPVVGVSSYHGYHYADSTEFCAKACHAVMEPEGDTHALSAHARVACAGCHIGSGATSFVQAKMNGTRQLFKVLTNSYPQPVPPSVLHIPTAEHTCTECHWPAKYFGNQLKTVARFSPDERNTRRDVRMMLKTGGGDPVTGRVEGIHMHMALAFDIQYVASDEKLQEIPWVRMTDRDGKEQIYRSDGRPASDPPPAGLARRIDCLDCHNRVGHAFRSPQDAVDLAMSLGQIDTDLPFFKREAVAVLDTTYENKAAAASSIEKELLEFYQREYPLVWNASEPAIRKSVATVVGIRDRIAFEHMKVDWKTYPDNVGHRHSSGCFRCHDGRHVNATGQTISSDCKVCHTFFNPLEGGGFVEGEFIHSFDLSVHGNLRCEQCHTGGVLPLCRDCHQSGDWLEARGRGRFIPHESARSKLTIP